MECKSKLLEEKPAEKLDMSLSVSKLKSFKSCKKKFQFDYIQKLPKKDWEHLSFGKFLHLVLEEFHKALLAGNTDPFHILMGRCFKDALPKYKLTAEQRQECFQILCKYIERMALERKEEREPTYIAAERSFYVNIDDKVLLNGFVDRIQIDPDGVLHISDYKSSKSKEFLKKDLFQLQTYAFVYFLENPDLQLIRCSYIMLRFDFEYITKEYTRDKIMKIEEKFLECAENIKKEKLFRPTTTKLCGYCDHLDLCAEGKAFINKDKKFGETDW